MNIDVYKWDKNSGHMRLVKDCDILRLSWDFYTLSCEIEILVNYVPRCSWNTIEHDFKIPSQSHPIQSHKIPPQSHKTQPKSHKTPLRSHNIPPQSHKTPIRSQKTQPKSHKTPLQSHNIPPQSHNISRRLLTMHIK